MGHMGPFLLLQQRLQLPMALSYLCPTCKTVQTHVRVATIPKRKGEAPIVICELCGVVDSLDNWTNQGKTEWFNVGGGPRAKA
jgi:hypothetical protein